MGEDDNASSEALGIYSETSGTRFRFMNARSSKVRVNHKDEGERRNGAYRPPSGEELARPPDDPASARAEPAAGDAPRGSGPLSEEQAAFYQHRIEEGFYCSDAIRRHIAQRLADEVFPKKAD